MVSVVIAAHNEAAVLPRCLAALLRDARPDEFEVIVAANGCTDGTAAVARAVPGVRVVELAEAGKAKALNAGDAEAVRLPRLYLDADIVLDTAAVRTLAAALDAPGVLVAVPRRDLDTTGRPWPVRAYYRIHSRLPALHNGLYGRGAIAVSAAGRARFAEFPTATADDLFLDSLFGPDERVQVESVGAVVATPLRTADLVRRLGRVRAGNAAMRASGSTVRRADRWSWLRDVVVRRPALIPHAVCYVALTATAALLGRRARRDGTVRWDRDDSSRTPA